MFTRNLESHINLRTQLYIGCYRVNYYRISAIGIIAIKYGRVRNEKKLHRSTMQLFIMLDSFRGVSVLCLG